MSRNSSRVVRVTLITAVAATSLVLGAGTANAASSLDLRTAIASAGIKTTPLALGGIGLMATGIVLVVVSLILRRRATH